MTNLPPTLLPPLSVQRSTVEPSSNNVPKSYSGTELSLEYLNGYRAGLYDTALTPEGAGLRMTKPYTQADMLLAHTNGYCDGLQSIAPNPLGSRFGTQGLFTDAPDPTVKNNGFFDSGGSSAISSGWTDSLSPYNTTTTVSPGVLQATECLMSITQNNGHWRPSGQATDAATKDAVNNAPIISPSPLHTGNFNADDIWEFIMEPNTPNETPGVSLSMDIPAGKNVANSNFNEGESAESSSGSSLQEDVVKSEIDMKPSRTSNDVIEKEEIQSLVEDMGSENSKAPQTICAKSQIKHCSYGSEAERENNNQQTGSGSSSGPPVMTIKSHNLPISGEITTYPLEIILPLEEPGSEGNPINLESNKPQCQPEGADSSDYLKMFAPPKKSPEKLTQLRKNFFINSLEVTLPGKTDLITFKIHKSQPEMWFNKAMGTSYDIKTLLNRFSLHTLKGYLDGYPHAHLTLKGDEWRGEDDALKWNITAQRDVVIQSLNRSKNPIRVDCEAVEIDMNALQPNLGLNQRANNDSFQGLKDTPAFNITKSSPTKNTGAKSRLTNLKKRTYQPEMIIKPLEENSRHPKRRRSGSLTEQPATQPATQSSKQRKIQATISDISVTMKEFRTGKEVSFAKQFQRPGKTWVQVESGQPIDGEHQDWKYLQTNYEIISIRGCSNSFTHVEIYPDGKRWTGVGDCASKDFDVEADTQLVDEFFNSLTLAAIECWFISK